MVTLRDLSRMIDHSLLHPTFTDDDLREGCAVARCFDVAAVCIKPYAIELACEILGNSDVAVCAVIGFPHGNSTTAIKVREATEAVRAGGREIDMVVNIGKALGGDWPYVAREIAAIQEGVVAGGSTLKVIFENDYLQESHIIRLCEICSNIGVAFVKTSTGYGFVKQANGMYSHQGATVSHLQLMRAHCPPQVQIKAAGGVRNLNDLLRVRALGVTRVGATATRTIMEEAKERGLGAAPVRVTYQHDPQTNGGY